MDNNDVVSTLNRLIAIAKDGVNGMKSAAEHARSANLKTVLEGLSAERGQVASELESLVRGLGGDPEKGGTTLGAAHRGWMNLKEAVTIADDKSLIEECERGEDSAMKEFREASAQPFPAQVQAQVLDCFQQVKRSHDQLRRLRDAVSSA